MVGVAGPGNVDREIFLGRGFEIGQVGSRRYECETLLKRCLVSGGEDRAHKKGPEVNFPRFQSPRGCTYLIVLDPPK